MESPQNSSPRKSTSPPECVSPPVISPNSTHVEVAGNGALNGDTNSVVDIPAAPADEIPSYPLTHTRSPPRRSTVDLCCGLTVSIEIHMSSRKATVMVILSIFVGVQIASTVLWWAHAVDLTFRHQIIIGGVNIAAAICMVFLTCIPFNANLISKAIKQMKAPYADLSVVIVLVDILLFFLWILERI